ncbi:MAG: hypothetical protein KF795_00385 [Labilithrix sp.]|nr:hypothetical protein [Labilithrix sp.]
MTDATGSFVLDGNVPVGKEFLLVVKAGRFRRATLQTIPTGGECQTTSLPSALPANPTRLPRNMTDGLAVNIPRIAITTGQLDAMECVFEKMGIAHAEFGNPGPTGAATPRVHLYRGGPSAPGSGARIDDNTPHDGTIYGDLARLQNYDMLVADCEGGGWDDNFNQRTANGAKVREYVNRGGRMFASHLSFSWLHANGTQSYAAGTAIDTGFGPAATWEEDAITNINTGTGGVSVGRPNASPRIANFRDWMVREGVVGATAPFNFMIDEPRSQTTGLGSASEEFVHRTETLIVQQFSFNTPYGAPSGNACGRVAYSGFHVVTGNASNAVFPAHCTGNLSSQEKVLLYMLFDLGACVGVDLAPPLCTPVTCAAVGASCGPAPDGCGKLLDCGPCGTPPK